MIIMETKKTNPQLVKTLMHIYPKLDYLMAETLPSFSENELGKMLEEKSFPKSVDDDQISEI